MLVSDSITIDRVYREHLRRANLETAEAVLSCHGDGLAAWSRTTDTIYVHLDDGRTTLYVKRYHYPRWRHRFRAMFRGTFFGSSRAASEFRTLSLMRQLGIQAVRPVAYGERRIGHFVRSCFLITEGVPDAMPLSAFIKQFADHRSTARAVRLRREILSALARQIRHMHEAGFVHFDLFWRNVLIRALPDDRFEFYFIDASVGRRIRLPQRRLESIVGDLAALGAAAPHFCSKADQLRFLLEYFDADALSPDKRQWLRRVQTQSDRLRPAELERIRRGSYFDSPVAESLEVV